MASSSGATNAGDDVVSEKYLVGKEWDAVVGRKRFPRFIADGVGSPNRGPAIVPRFPGPEAEFVDNGRRKRRNQPAGNHARRAADQTTVTTGPVRDTGLRGHTPISLPCSAECRLVFCVETMIDAEVVLVSIGVVAIAVRRILTFDAAKPTIARDVQAVAVSSRDASARSVIVRQRHSAD